VPTKIVPIPTGPRAITPYLTINGAAKGIEFYKKAFGAQEVHRMPSPDGKISHAELKIGDSTIMVNDEFPGMAVAPPASAVPSSYLFLYVTDVDATFKRSVEAGAKSTMPVQDMFWGDRFGRLVDPFGHSWSLATHVEDVAPAEMGKRAQEAAAKMAQQVKAAG